jgi:acyl-coenzyme A thioesterase PaaI-like protein
MKLLEFLGGEEMEDGMRFRLGRDLHGAFEGAFGGVVAACSLVAARMLAGGRRPVSLDCQFIRSLPAGEVIARPSLVRTGRTRTVVVVDVGDDRDDLAAGAVASFADPDFLHPFDDAGMVRPGASVAYKEASPWKLRTDVAPIVGTLEPRFKLTDPGLMATVLQVPWDGEDGTGAEAACLAADMAVGPPVAADLGDSWVPHPNPDLSIRFANDAAVREVAGIARLERIASGVAIVRVEVFSGIELLAVSISTSLLLNMGVVNPHEQKRPSLFKRE